MQDEMKKAVERYLAAWNETDGAKRKAILERVFARDCTYVDPFADLRGVDAIDGFIGNVQRHYKGAVFVLGNTFDAHHAQARFTWNAMAPGVTEPIAIGFDVALFEEKGLIRDVRGFIDRAPPQ